MKKRVISLLLTLCMVVGLLPAALAAAPTFKDVPADMWCYDEVEFVAENGYFKGKTTTTFDPNGTMTRQQFVTVLGRMAGAKVDNTQSAFTDVAVNTYATGYIAWAAKEGIVTGYADGTFRPYEPVTRQQMCAFMSRFMTYYAKANNVTFAKKGVLESFADDKDIASYAKEAVDQCRVYGLVNGYSDKTFRPTATASRAHVAAVIYRLANVIQQVSGGSFIPDGIVYTADPDDLLMTAHNNTATYANSVAGKIADAINAAAGSAGSADSKITINPVTVSATSDTSDRTVNVSAAATLGANVDDLLVNTAVNYALGLVSAANGTNAPALTYTQVKDIVKATVEALGLTWTGTDIEALAKQIYDANTNTGAVVDVAKKAWSNFKKDGKTIISNVAVKNGDAVVATISAKADAVDAAKAVAKVVAKELYAGLKQYTDYTSTVVLSSDLTLDYTVAGDFTETCAPYSTIYNVNASLTLTDATGTLAYKYGANGSYVKLTLKDSQYEAAMDQISAAVVNSDKLRTELGTKLNTALEALNYGSLVNNLASAPFAGRTVNVLKDGVNTAALESAMKTAMLTAVSAEGGWLDTNLTIDATPIGAPYYLLYDFFWNQGGKIEAGKAMLNGNEVDLCDNSAFVAAIKGTLNGKVKDDYVEWVDMTVDTFIDAIVTGEILDAVSAYETYLNKLGTVSCLQNMTNVKLQSLISVLESDMVLNAVNGVNVDVLTKLQAVVDKLPASASVTVAGLTIDQAKLQAVAAAGTNAALCQNIANMLKPVSALTLGSFAGEGQEVNVTYGNHSYTVNFVVEVVA